MKNQEIGSFKDEAIKDLTEGFYKQLEEAFLKALESNGLPTTTDFIHDNIKRVTIEGDAFDHYWYRFGQHDAKRILSIEKPNMRSGQMGDDYINNNYKIIIEAKYY